MSGELFKGMTRAQVAAVADAASRELLERALRRAMIAGANVSSDDLQRLQFAWRLRAEVKRAVASERAS